MTLFRRSGEVHGLAIAMTGVRLGERFMQIGCTDGTLLAAVASKVGVSGRACVCVATPEDMERARRAAERAGVLIEIERSAFDHLPYEDAAFDLVVVDSQDGLIANAQPERRVALLQDAKRVLTSRGRIIIIERAPRAGLGALITRSNPQANPHYVNTGGAETALRAEGFKAVRQLAERDGMSFFEGIA